MARRGRRRGNEGILRVHGARAVHALVARLELIGQGGERVLSAFVDTSADAGGTTAAVAALRQSCGLVRMGVPFEQHAAFDRAAGLAIAYLAGNACVAPGLALFVEPTGQIGVVALPTRPIEGAAWAEHPAVRRLAAALLPSGRVQVVLYDRVRHRNRCVGVPLRPPRTTGESAGHDVKGDAR
jgi:hypothetical protein